MQLCIVIPALNEERSIASIIERTLAAKSTLMDGDIVTAVSVVVVSDGSTDETAAIARRWEPHITVLDFASNRGYGAAIKAGWSTSEAELLAFLDADGTCDPLFFRQLITVLASSGADIAVGNRLNSSSKMPALRRLGNRLFAILLTTLATRRVTDTASGMRVIRRSALPQLLPLPDGLHFTPAMTAIALLGDQVLVVEVPMPYHEREGESKLHAGRDGLRFLKVILQSAFLYRPARFLLPPAMVLGLCALALGLIPAVGRFTTGEIAPRAVPALLMAELTLTTSTLFASAAYLSERLVLALLPLRRRRVVLPKLVRLVSSRLFWTAPGLLFFAGVLILLKGWTELIEGSQTGLIPNMAELLAAILCLTLCVVLALTRLLNQYIDVMQDRLRGEDAYGSV